uniref:Cnidarian restricted protein n=1 Tax=Clytia hemisphaerica TaxID=252671 RepID=A0A7M5VGC1_9CNID
MAWQFFILLLFATINHSKSYSCESDCKASYAAVIEKVTDETTSTEMIRKVKERGDKHCALFCDLPRWYRDSCQKNCQGNANYYQCFSDCASNHSRYVSEEIEIPEPEPQVFFNVHCYDEYITVEETFSWGSISFITPTVKCEIVQ